MADGPRSGPTPTARPSASSAAPSAVSPAHSATSVPVSSARLVPGLRRASTSTRTASPPRADTIPPAPAPATHAATVSRRRGLASSSQAAVTTACQPRPRATWLSRWSATPRTSQPGETPPTALTSPSKARSRASATLGHPLHRLPARPNGESKRPGSAQLRRCSVLCWGSRPAARRSSGELIGRERPDREHLGDAVDRQLERASGAPRVQTRVIVTRRPPRSTSSVPPRLLALPVARGEQQRAAGPERARHRASARRAGPRRARASCRRTARRRSRRSAAGPPRRAPRPSTPSARVRATISGLMSEACAS